MFPSSRILEEIQEGLKSFLGHSGPKEINVSSGTVKWFNEKKGFGFITPDEGGDDLFVHHTKIDMQGFRTLKEGQRVEFEVTAGEKGKIAVNVKPV